MYQRKNLWRNNYLKKTAMKILYPVDTKFKISQKFGWRVHPITNERDFHTGVDIACPSGTPIKASYNGIVTRVWWDNKNGLALRYLFESETDQQAKLFSVGICHLSEVLVGPGDRVTKGQAIAFSGVSGQVKGAHLHFTLRKNNEAIDPAPYFIS